jgi:hypothetical protein
MSTRKSIRDNIVTRLKAAVPVSAIVGTRVEVGHANVTSIDGTPRIYLYTTREEIDTHTLSVAREQMRRMSLNVDFWRKETANNIIDDQLDDAADKISTAITADTTCGGFCRDCILTSLEYVIEGTEEARFGVARLAFTITYFTREA